MKTAPELCVGDLTFPAARDRFRGEVARGEVARGLDTVLSGESGRVFRGEIDGGAPR